MGRRFTDTTGRRSTAATACRSTNLAAFRPTDTNARRSTDTTARRSTEATAVSDNAFFLPDDPNPGRSMNQESFFRGRRLRQTPALRSLVRETHLDPSQLILPLFVEEGEGLRQPVPSLPGVDRTSPDELVRDGEEAVALGLGGVILFGIPGQKDGKGSGAWAEDGIVQKGVRALREACPELTIITDVCLCEYTDHGHCGVLEEGRVLNDPTLELLSRTAVSHARAGADMVAPSDMMDGRIGAVRRALDESGFSETPIMSYAAKYASAFYGPFRDAADSTPETGDRRGYQMDPANSREALLEVQADVEQGADILMVKPALAYLDIIHQVRSHFRQPVAAYHVSGEFAAVMAGARLGWLDEEAAMTEALLSIRRAGADLILTYWARQYARLHGSR